MMDYAKNTVSVSQTMPELGRLKAASERVYNAQVQISNFIDRFHGQMPEAASGGALGAPADSYRNDLESLFIQIERLEGVVSALNTIG